MNPTFLIRNLAAIMTGGAGATARHHSPDIRLRGERIDAIGELVPEPQDEIIDASGCVAYPAWVNTHHHLFQSIMKGDPHGLNLPLTPWLAATPYRLRPHIDESLFRLAVRIGMVELIRSGCGTIADHNYLYYPGMSFDPSAILFEEADRLGVRFVLCRGGATRTRQIEATLPRALMPESMDAYCKDIERLTARYHDPAGNARRRIVVAPTTPLHSVAPLELRELARLARSLGLRLHSHLAETVNYQDTAWDMYQESPVSFVSRHEWLGPDVWFAHLVKLGDDEIRELGQSGTGIAHCPQSNGRLGSGIAPLGALQKAGVPISIGVDGAASNEAADMLSETHAAWLFQRARKGESARPTRGGGAYEGGADAATIEDVIRWGTDGGAKILGLDEIGRIEVGMQADLAIYSLDDPRFFGLHDPAIVPVASAGRASVRALFVAGTRLVANDSVRGVDLGELHALSLAAVKTLRHRCDAASS